MLGFVIGAVTGAVQYFLLSKFTGGLTRGKVTGKTILFALIQFLMPFIVLVAVAFLLRDQLVFTAIGMASALMISAIVKFIFVSKAK